MKNQKREFLISQRKSRLIEVQGKTRPWRQKDVKTQLESLYNYRVSVSYIGAIERGERDPSLELCKLLARLYGKSIEELF